MMSFCVMLLLGSALVLAQTVSFGVRAGIPLSNLVSADQNQPVSTLRYTVGPTLDVHLPYGFAIGADFLYTRVEFGRSPSAATVHRWELPLLLTRDFTTLPASPFVRAGVSFDRVFEIEGANKCGEGPFGEQFYCVDGGVLAELRHRGTHGLVLGGGMQFRQHAIRLAPELRLTRWADRNFGVRNSTLRSNLTELEILLGILF